MCVRLYVYTYIIYRVYIYSIYVYMEIIQDWWSLLQIIHLYLMKTFESLWFSDLIKMNQNETNHRALTQSRPSFPSASPVVACEANGPECQTDRPWNYEIHRNLVYEICTMFTSISCRYGFEPMVELVELVEFQYIFHGDTAIGDLHPGPGLQPLGHQGLEDGPDVSGICQFCVAGNRLQRLQRGRWEKTSVSLKIPCLKSWLWICIIVACSWSWWMISIDIWYHENW